MNSCLMKQQQPSHPSIHDLICNPSLILTHISGMALNDNLLDIIKKDQGYKQQIQSVVALIRETEKMNRMKSYDILMVMVREIWSVMGQLKTINNKVYENKPSKPTNRRRGQFSLSDVFTTLQCKLKFLWHCIHLTKHIIIGQSYFLQTLYSSMMIPVLKQLALNSLLDSDFFQHQTNHYQSNFKIHLKHSLFQKSKHKLHQLKESQLPQNSKITSARQVQSAHKTPIQTILLLNDAIKQFSYEFITWMGINFPLNSHNINMKSTSIFCIQFHAITHKQSSVSGQQRSFGNQISCYQKIMDKGYKYFSLEDKIQYEQKLSQIHKLPHSAISKSLISFYLNFWLSYFLLNHKRLPQKKNTQIDSVKQSNHSSKKPSLTQQDLLEIQLGMKEYAFSQIINTRDYMLIELGLQTLFEGFFVLQPQTKLNTRNDYPNEYDIKRQVILGRILRLVTMIIFTGQLQSISKINSSRVLLKLFNFIFIEYRQQIKEKCGQIDSELEKQFIVMLRLLKHMTKGLKLSSEMHQAIEQKILTVYTRYEVQEMLDEYGYWFGQKISTNDCRNTGCDKIINFEQLLQHLTKDKIIPHYSYNEQKFAFFVFNIQQKVTLTKISQSIIPKVNSQFQTSYKKTSNIKKSNQKQKSSLVETNRFDVTYGDKRQTLQGEDSWKQAQDYDEYQIPHYQSKENKVDVRREQELMVYSNYESKIDRKNHKKQPITALTSNLKNEKLSPFKKLLSPVKPSQSSILKITLPTPKKDQILKSQISFMPGQYPLPQMFEIEEQSKEYTSGNPSHSMTDSNEGNQEQLLRQYKLKKKRKQIEKMIGEEVDKKIRYHQKIFAELNKMEDEKNLRELQEARRRTSPTKNKGEDVNSMISSVSGSRYSNESSTSKWKAIMKKQKSKHSYLRQQKHNQPPDNYYNNFPQSLSQNSPTLLPHNATRLVQTAKFLPLVQTAKFYQNLNSLQKISFHSPIQNSQALNQQSKMGETGNFFRSKKEMESSKNSLGNNMLDKMQNSLDNLKTDLLKKHTNLVESKHTIMKDSNHFPRQFMSSFQLTNNSKQTDNLKEINTQELPLIKQEGLIKKESEADDAGPKGQNSVQNNHDTNNQKNINYQDKFFTNQEMLYLQNLQKQQPHHSDLFKSPQKKHQAKQYVKQNLKQIYERNQLILNQKQQADRETRKKHKKNHLALNSNLLLKDSQSDKNLKSTVILYTDTKLKKFRELKDSNVSPEYKCKTQKKPKPMKNQWHIAQKNPTQNDNISTPQQIKLPPVFPFSISELENFNKSKQLLFSNDFIQIGWLRKTSRILSQQYQLVLNVDYSYHGKQKINRLLKHQNQLVQYNDFAKINQRQLFKPSIVLELVQVKCMQQTKNCHDLDRQIKLIYPKQHQNHPQSHQIQYLTNSSTITSKRYDLNELSQKHQPQINLSPRSPKTYKGLIRKDNQFQFCLNFYHCHINRQIRQKQSQIKREMRQKQSHDYHNQKQKKSPKERLINPNFQILNKEINIHQLQLISCNSKLDLEMQNPSKNMSYIQSQHQQSHKQIQHNKHQWKDYKLVVRIQQQTLNESLMKSGGKSGRNFIKISNYQSAENLKSVTVTQTRILLFNPLIVTHLPNIDKFKFNSQNYQQSIATQLPISTIEWKYGLIYPTKHIKTTSSHFYKDEKSTKINFQAISYQWNPLKLQFTTLANKASKRIQEGSPKMGQQKLQIKCPQLLKSVLASHLHQEEHQKAESPKIKLYKIDGHGNVNIWGQSKVEGYFYQNIFYSIVKSQKNIKEQTEEIQQNQMIKYILSSVILKWHLQVLTRNLPIKTLKQQQLILRKQTTKMPIKQFKLQLNSYIQIIDKNKPLKSKEQVLLGQLTRRQHLQSFSKQIMNHFQKIFQSQ